MAGFVLSHFTFHALDVLKEVTTFVVLRHYVGLASFRELIDKLDHIRTFFEKIERITFRNTILLSVVLILLIIDFFDDD